MVNQLLMDKTQQHLQWKDTTMKLPISLLATHPDKHLHLDPARGKKRFVTATANYLF
jgi:hypothetical protein